MQTRVSILNYYLPCDYSYSNIGPDVVLRSKRENVSLPCYNIDIHQQVCRAGTMCARLTLTSRLISDQSRPVVYGS